MTDIIAALAIAIIVLYFVISGKINRTIIASAGAVLMIVFGMHFKFYSQENAFHAVDFNTLGLLAGMMIIVSVLKKTGLFSFLAVKTAKASGGSPWRLMVMMGIVTALISMVLDNVTTIILVIPVTILVCDMLGISPLPTIMAEILLANIGGTGTLIGDPPNMMIGSASGLSFFDFVRHLLPLVALTMIVGLIVLRLIFYKELNKPPRNIESVLKINETRALSDRPAIFKSIGSLVIVFILFLLQKRYGFHHSFIALLGASLVLILVRPNIDEILKDVQWSVLIFFAALFIIVGGLEKAGVVSFIAQKIAYISEVNFTFAKLTILWASAIFSSLVDRVPFTAAMIPVIKHLGSLGFDIKSLWWILALGVGFGGNGSPIGSIVGVVGVAMSEKTRNPIDFKTWFRTGTVIMIVSIIVISFFITLI